MTLANDGTDGEQLSTSTTRHEQTERGVRVRLSLDPNCCQSPKHPPQMNELSRYGRACAFTPPTYSPRQRKLPIINTKKKRKILPFRVDPPSPSTRTAQNNDAPPQLRCCHLTSTQGHQPYLRYGVHFDHRGVLILAFCLLHNC